MGERFFIMVTVVVVILVLIALNAASYVKIEQAGDSEGWPDRSTFNSGATGTRALYDFLRESGYQVTRWSESPSSLLSISGPKPATIVVIGRTVLPISKTASNEMLLRVETGVLLVLIDRSTNQN